METLGELMLGVATAAVFTEQASAHGVEAQAPADDDYFLVAAEAGVLATDLDNVLMHPPLYITRPGGIADAPGSEQWCHLGPVDGSGVMGSSGAEMALQRQIAAIHGRARINDQRGGGAAEFEAEQVVVAVAAEPTLSHLAEIGE